MKVLVRVILVMLIVSEMRPMRARAEVGTVSASLISTAATATSGVPYELANHPRHIKISSSRRPIILTTPSQLHP
ncbi:hypothetical protein BJY52DRAFT_1272313 [Lactarius psammicola]|nr:hypothetical protein BJY52DRAFT_1272313 [Lactarius psammicola]